MQRLFSLPRHRQLTLALACAGLALIAGLLPGSAGAAVRPLDGSGSSVTPSGSPSGSSGIGILTSDFRVRWSSIAPIPLAKERAATFAFTTTGTQDRGRVLARVSTLAGELVRELSTGQAILDGAGELRWNGRDDDGQPVPNGVYAVQLVALSRVGEEHPTAVRRMRLERPTTTRTIYRVNGAGRRIALTFDDCNFQPEWNRILTALEEGDAHATFFCLGKTVQLYPQAARRTVALGNDIGSHSFAHPDLRYASFDRILDELDRTTRSWWSIDGVTPIPYFRPPYGDFDGEVLRALGLRGYPTCVLWDVDPSDWTDPGAAVIRDRVLSRVRPGSIVLLHVKPQTADALPGILKGLRKLHLRPVTLTELLVAGAAVTSGDVTLPY